MNRVCLVGRLTKEPDMRISPSGTNVTRFSIAVNRTRKVEGQPDADFINCVAFGKSAEFIAKYLQKGYLVSVDGRIQTGSYENEKGQRIYTTDVLCDSVQNLTQKQDGTKDVAGELSKMGLPVTTDEEYTGSLNITDADLPF